MGLFGGNSSSSSVSSNAITFNPSIIIGKENTNSSTSQQRQTASASALAKDSLAASVGVGVGGGSGRGGSVVQPTTAVRTSARPTAFQKLSAMSKSGESNKMYIALGGLGFIVIATFLFLGQRKK